MNASGCAAPDQSGPLPAGIDVTRETVLSGRVVAGDQPVGGAFVRLLDSSGEFTAEVVASADGRFRFFAAPGDWTVRALARAGKGQAALRAGGPGVHEAEIALT